MPGSGLKVCGGGCVEVVMVVVVSNPILVISLKPKSRLINMKMLGKKDSLLFKNS